MQGEEADEVDEASSEEDDNDDSCSSNEGEDDSNSSEEEENDATDVSASDVIYSKEGNVAWKTTNPRVRRTPARNVIHYREGPQSVTM